MLRQTTILKLKSGEFLAEILDLPKPGFGEILPSEVMSSTTMYLNLPLLFFFWPNFMLPFLSSAPTFFIPPGPFFYI